jgi:RNA-dependent RNA polymerase
MNGQGDFTKLERKPARLAARWSQAFSSTDPSVTLETSQIRHIEDRWNTDRSSIFTDGCGTISPALAHEVWSRLQFANRKPSRLTTPSCFQIRLGGAKGVIIQDAKLSGKVICLRPSQVKFDAPQSLTLDIAATSSRPSPMFLNRPLIVLLEHLGVHPRQIVNLQEQAICHVEASRSLAMGPALLQQHGLGASFRLPSLFSNILKFLHLDVNLDSDQDSDRILNHELIRECLRSAAAYVLREIKHRARIPVPGSYTLLGVSDEANCLEEGQIYVTIKDERTGLYKPVRGKVLITRSPQIHPGDVQFVEAVDCPGLRHLTNVVVFSCR